MFRLRQICFLLLLVSTGIVAVKSSLYFGSSEHSPYKFTNTGHYFHDRESEREARQAGNTGVYQEVEGAIKQESLSIPIGTFTTEITGRERIIEVTRINSGLFQSIHGINTQHEKLFATAYSPDGKIIASGGLDTVIKLWDTETGKNISSLENPIKEYKVFDLTFSPDGKLLVSAGKYLHGTADTNIVIWNVTSGKILKSLPGYDCTVYSLEFSPDGKRLASCDWGGYADWTKVKEFKGHDGIVNSVHFSPDGKLLASAGDDNALKFWNTTSWELDRPILFSQSVVAVRFSPDGKYLATGCGTGTSTETDLRLYDVKSMDYHPLEGHVSGMGEDAIDFSPDSKLLATGGKDETVRLWNATSGDLITVLAGHARGVKAVAFSPDGTMIAAGSHDGIIWMWNVARGAEKENLIGHESTVYSAVFSPDGQILASGSYDSNIILWNVTTGDKIHTLTEHDAAVHSVAFSPDGKLLVSGSWDTTVRLWNVTDGKELPDSPLTHHTSAVRPVIFSHDGKVVISGSISPEHAIRLWNVTSKMELTPLTPTSNDVSSLALSPDGSLLASGNRDWKIKIWNITSGQYQEWKNHEEQVYSVAFSPNGELLASGSWDNTVRIWNVTNGSELRVLGGSGGGIQSVIFSPNGELVAAGSYESTIRLWNVTSGEKAPVKTIHVPATAVFSVDFSPDGKLIASGDNNGNVKLWNVNAVPDGDLDGMPDDWESENGLDPLDPRDKFDDNDNDGLINSLEHFRKSSPLERDSDSDGMPDGWEHLSGVNPAFPDADNDSDADGITALYEFQTGLNPWLNDAAADKDSDGLANYIEFLFGSWANMSDSDLDGMLDKFEYEHGLLPLIDDSSLDEDEDGMTNLFEAMHNLDATNASDAFDDKDNDRMINQYEAIHDLNASDSSDANIDKDGDGMENWYEAVHDLNATDPADARQDPDGDWVINIDEFRSNTDPNDFFSFPLLSFSVFHATAGLLFVISSLVITYFVLTRRKEQHMSFASRLKAPDYQTALKIHKAGYKDYFDFIKGVNSARTLVEEGIASYYQGDTVKAKNLYERALSVFDRVDNKALVAETIFRVVNVLKESHELETDSKIIKRFPPSPWKEPVIEAIYQMIKALLAETEMNWGLAKMAWQTALDTGVLNIEFQVICQGALAEFAVRNWLDNPVVTSREPLIKQVDEWLTVSETYQQQANLCQGYLLRSKIAFASVQFDEMEKWLNKCSLIAKENNLVIYRDRARKELEALSFHKERVSTILDTEKPATPEEQERMLQEYIKEALNSLKEKGLQ
ncbi:MAG: eIF2A-related protein [Candidatus Hodarchaeales archaeon]